MANGTRRRLSRYRHLAAALGLIAGAVCGAAVAGFAGAEQRSAAVGSGAMQATHLPPLLRLPDEPVELRYDVYCLSESPESADEPCAASGTVFVRAGTRGPFRELELTEARGVDEGRFRVVVPSNLVRARDAFSYYAIFRSASGEHVVPEGGASAPQISLALDKPVQVVLGSHQFGRALSPTARVAEAAWGDGPDEVRLEPGTDSVRIGPSSFDVGADGTVHLLDQARGRVLRWRGRAARPEATPLDVNGTIADLAVADDGTTHVLESTESGTGGTMLRVFGPGGEAISAGDVGDGLSQVRIGPDGSAVVHRPSSGQWLAAARDGQAVRATARNASGRPGRPLKSGGEVVVLRSGNEIRVALVPERGRARSWQITSATSLAEVQLAEKFGTGLLLVTRVYDTDDEYVALVVDDRGPVSTFALESPEWAEAAPLSRFRLVGSSLYRLGSTADGVFVDRFDLEVPR